MNSRAACVNTNRWVWYFLMLLGVFWAVAGTAMWIGEPSAVAAGVEAVGSLIFVVSLLRSLRGNPLVSCNEQELAFYYRPPSRGFRLQKIIIPTRFIRAVEYRAGFRHVRGIGYEQILFVVVSKEGFSREREIFVQRGSIRLLRSADDDSFILRQTASFNGHEMQSLVTFLRDGLGVPAVIRKIADTVQADEMQSASHAAQSSSYARV